MSDSYSHPELAGLFDGVFGYERADHCLQALFFEWNGDVDLIRLRKAFLNDGSIVVRRADLYFLFDKRRVLLLIDIRLLILRMEAFQWNGEFVRHRRNGDHIA